MRAVWTPTVWQACSTFDLCRLCLTLLVLLTLPWTESRGQMYGCPSSWPLSRKPRAHEPPVDAVNPARRRLVSSSRPSTKGTRLLLMRRRGHDAPTGRCSPGDGPHILERSVWGRRQHALQTDRFRQKLSASLSSCRAGRAEFSSS